MGFVVERKYRCYITIGVHYQVTCGIYDNGMTATRYHVHAGCTKATEGGASKLSLQSDSYVTPTAYLLITHTMPLGDANLQLRLRMGQLMQISPKTSSATSVWTNRTLALTSDSAPQYASRQWYNQLATSPRGSDDRFGDVPTPTALGNWRATTSHPSSSLSGSAATG